MRDLPKRPVKVARWIGELSDESCESELAAYLAEAQSWMGNLLLSLPHQETGDAGVNTLQAARAFEFMLARFPREIATVADTVVQMSADVRPD